jgi:hypothetical protein
VRDLFVDASLRDSAKRKPKEFTDPAKIRDYIAYLEKAADKHQHRQPRTIDPVKFAVSIGDAISNVEDSESGAATKTELDLLLQHGIDTTQVKHSAHAQRLIQRLVDRKKLGLASAKQLSFLIKLGFPEDKAATMSAKQAGAIIGKQMGQWR